MNDDGALKIVRATNGWVMTQDGETYVVERDGSSAEVAQRLLWEVIELLGLSGSRYDAERVTVIMKPGDKYVDPGSPL